ncbi:MAG: 6-carboxytetrahydropterin synthase QueD [Spirochaetales bacterium]|nr:6-carboxytetrahydropterin synthase QueD [Spirochaetales bacterium]RKX86897.1 MAG: 6-carboxytetrahydropterin synthase QueD [Spirochaetota bacterium]
MFSVRVEEYFSAAHFLSDYHGKCERLHGHNYRVRVTVKGSKLDKGGMLLDFGIIKKKLREIIGLYDHMNLNECEDFRDGNPSAERIAYSIYKRLSPFIDEAQNGRASHGSNFTIEKVEVFETDKNLAAYMPD